MISTSSAPCSKPGCATSRPRSSPKRPRRGLPGNVRERRKSPSSWRTSCRGFRRGITTCSSPSPATWACCTPTWRKTKWITPTSASASNRVCESTVSASNSWSATGEIVGRDVGRRKRPCRKNTGSWIKSVPTATTILHDNPLRAKSVVPSRLGAIKRTWYNQQLSAAGRRCYRWPQQTIKTERPRLHLIMGIVVARRSCPS